MKLSSRAGESHGGRPKLHALLLNQTFYPDVVSTAQHLKDLALGLVERGHSVTVITSQRAYDNPAKRFPKHEHWRGIEIYRVGSTGLGKSAKWKRAFDFATFLLSATARLFTVRRPDIVVALTSPPLISFVAATYASVRGSRFIYWVMDLNPDEAIVAGWLKEDSTLARILDSLSRFSFRRAEKIIVLDSFMAQRVSAKSIPHTKIQIVPPWSHDDVIRFDAEGRESFRKVQNIEGKFVVMYSGNHSPCHSLSTLLNAARILAEHPLFVFMFIGGGSEMPKVQEFARKNDLRNIRTLPYQPLDQLSGSLSAADLHVVVMGNEFVGTIHPCKIYNVLAVGAPVLYIGPSPSHVTEIFGRMSGSKTIFCAPHGDAAHVAQQIKAAAEVKQRGEPHIYQRVASEFSRNVLLPRQVALVESELIG